jgi:hypothetical protein
MQVHIDPLNAPLTTAWTSSLFVINPYHQPLIRKHSYKEYIACHRVVTGVA